MSPLNPHEEATIRAFIIPERRPRYLEQMALPNRRRRFLNRLNHCRDFDQRFVVPVQFGRTAVDELLHRGAPSSCHVISDTAAIDGLDLPLTEAVNLMVDHGWGTILCCIAGQLALYRDEAGTRREFILARDS